MPLTLSGNTSVGQSAHQALDPDKTLPDVSGERGNHVRGQIRRLTLHCKIVDILKGCRDIGEHFSGIVPFHVAAPSASTR